MDPVDPEIDLRWDPDPSWSPWTVGAPRGSKVLEDGLLEGLRRSTREELGLDPDRPVVVVGHQPVPWHPGILAKFMAGDAVARRRDAQLVHLVVDAHRGPFGLIEWPEGNGPDSLHTTGWQCVDFDASTPMCRQPASGPLPPPVDGAASEVLDGLRSWHDALASFIDAPNAAMQFAGALNSLMDPWVGPRTTIAASTLLDTSFGRWMLDVIREDPRRCVDACNQAIDGDPTLGIHRLADGGSGLELPFWIDRGGVLDTALDGDLDSEGSLHPKALALTALARVGLADLFIHGLGGWRYDVAMEHWIRSWLDVIPSPRAMVTATMHLPLLDPSLLAVEQARLVQRSRRRRHDPESSEYGVGPGPTKQRVLDQIALLPRSSQKRHEAYRSMHEWISSHAKSDEDGDLRAGRRLRELAAMQCRRTWAFPMYDSSRLDALRRHIHAACG